MDADMWAVAWIMMAGLDADGTTTGMHMAAGEDTLAEARRITTIPTQAMDSAVEKPSTAAVGSTEVVVSAVDADNW
jgi:hypothetical protein